MPISRNAGDDLTVAGQVVSRRSTSAPSCLSQVLDLARRTLEATFTVELPAVSNEDAPAWPARPLRTDGRLVPRRHVVDRRAPAAAPVGGPTPGRPEDHRQRQPDDPDDQQD